MQDFIVSGVKALLRLWLRLYFKEIRHTRRAIPNRGPLVFLGNHQNALLDALIIAAFNRRKTYFLVRSSVFKNARVARLLYFFGLRPIYRIRDGRDTLALNEPIFDFFAQMLVQGHCVLLFPEGNHSLNRTVRPLRKGFIEIINRAYALDPKTSIRLVAVGLSYQQPSCFFDRVAVHYSSPIDADPLFNNGLDLKSRDQQILERVSQELRDSTVHIPKVHYDEVLTRLIHTKTDFTEVQKANQRISQIIDDLALGDERFVPKEASITSCYYSSFQRFLLLMCWPVTFIWRLTIKPRIKEAEFISTFRFAYFTLWVTGAALMAIFTLLYLLILK